MTKRKHYVDAEEFIIIGIVCITVLQLAVGTVLFRQGSVEFDCKQKELACADFKEACNMRFKRNVSGFINGVYSRDNYYCVWVKDRTIEEIAGTESHEICHHIVFKDQFHFCEEKYVERFLK